MIRGRSSRTFGNKSEKGKIMLQGIESALFRAGKTQARVLAGALSMSLVFSASGVLAAPGDPDLSFGSGGTVVQVRGGSTLGSQQPTRQADGKWIIPYEADGLSGQINGTAGGVARLNANGTLDATFGYEGVAGTGRTTAAVMSGSDILVTGQSGDANFDYVWVAKLDSNGVLVPAFGTQGRTALLRLSPFTSGYAYQLLDGIALAPDGGILVAGQVANATGTGNLIALAKFTAAGVLDTTFGTSGVFTFNPLNTNTTFQMQRMAVMADGSIMLSGVNGENMPAVSAVGYVAKVTAAGAMDNTFGTNGIFSIANATHCPAMAIDGTGSLIGCSVNDDHRVFRLTATGTVDAGFTTTTVNIGTTDVPFTIQRLPSGNILVLGRGNNRFAAISLNSTGGLDTSFNPSGSVGYYVAPESEVSIAGLGYWNGSSIDVLGLRMVNGVASELLVTNLSTSGVRGPVAYVNPASLGVWFRVKALAGGKILAGGTTTYFANDTVGAEYRAEFGRYNADGSIDTGFANNGFISASLLPNFGSSGVRDFSVLPSGDIILTGDFGRATSGNVGVAKVLANGSVDTSFNASGPNPGQNIKSIGAPFTRNMRVLSDGKIMVTGQSTTPGPAQMGLVRFNADGTVDNTWGSSGLVRTTYATTSNPRYVEIDAAGNAVVVGQGSGQVRVARVTPAGVLDASFGTGGMVSIAMPSGFVLNLPNKIFVLPSGQLLIVVSGNFNNTGGVGLIRLTSSGAVDTSFGTAGFSFVTVTAETTLGANAFDAAITPNGRIMLTVQNTETSGGLLRTTLIRFNPNGQQDLSFGAGGVRHIQLANEGQVFVGIDVFPDGALALAGNRGAGNRAKVAVAKTVADPSAVLDITVAALTSSANPSLQGQSITFTAVVTGTTTPTGTVSFQNGISPISSCAAVTLSAGQAQCTTSALTSGTYSITASYSGDAGHLPATSNTILQQVNSANPTTTTLVSSLNPSQFGQSVTLTASVSSVSGSPSGTVSFADGPGAVTGCTSVPLVAGQAQCVTSSLSVGVHALTANYSGDVSFAASSSAVLNQAVQAPATGAGKRFDLNGDGKSDIVWRNGSTGQNWFWGMNGTAITAQGPITTLPVDWQIQSAALDFDGDGKSDILLRNMTTGQPWVWLMNGNAIIGGGSLPTLSDLSWIIAGTGDLNGDGKGDIVWRNTSTGQNWYWGMNGTAIIAQGPITALPPDWQIQSVLGDFNGDGKTDILWRNMVTGQPWVWIMDGNNVINNGPLPTLSDLNWTIAGTGDLDGDGRADIVWRNTSTGQNWWWGMNGQAIIAQGPITTLPSVWQFESIGADFDGDGKADILLRNTSTGQPWIWIMNANNITGGGPLPTLSDLNWQIKIKK